MNTSEINNELRHIKCFIGTFARDRLPSLTSLPVGLIVNTDKASDSGQHWIAIYIDKNGRGEYFDSFGFPSLHIDIINFLSLNTNRWQYSCHMLQHASAKTCGNYCIFYIKLRCNGFSQCQFIQLFTNITLINDKIVKSLFNKFL